MSEYKVYASKDWVGNSISMRINVDNGTPDKTYAEVASAFENGADVYMVVNIYDEETNELFESYTLRLGTYTPNDRIKFYPTNPYSYSDIEFTVDNIIREPK